MGNMRFIIELIRSNPDLIWKVDDKGNTIFHLAVKHRQKNIYNLIYEIGAMKDLITPVTNKKGNNMLHMVAKKAKQNQIQNVSGAALEMQRELSWFKEVEQLIPPSYRKKKNEDGMTPQDLFAKEHTYLIFKGEDWMNNYMVVATLIATIVFAAAFTLPGGYNQNTGKLEWVPITITCLAGVPVILFAKMQFHLLVDIFDYTYRSKYHFKPKKRSLYY
ncbi:putative ankyrin repeat-containing domain, PGG domain, ankyrin repeat-containing domain superfamily [Helianthus annuus]|nr:putative ankyrin repeat-containing domain, PGG domain, ankyrin repeat-containing domain superfamily [Helianthus annuus]